MAITRAQQAKQMLQKGGRIGLKGGADAATVGFDKSYDERVRTKDRPRSVDISPTGGVTTSRDAPDSVERDTGLERARQRNITKLDQFKNTKPPVKTPGPLKYIKGPLQILSNFTTTKNRKFFEDVIRAGKIPGLNFATLDDLTPEQLEQKYQDYMSERLAGNIDAYGNPLMSGDDDPFIPINQMSTNMDLDQAPEEEVLSPIQQAILDRGNASAFLATGGRVGLKGGADASQFDKSPSEQKSVDISPRGDVTLGSEPPKGPDDRGSSHQNMVQMLVNQGYTPKEIRRITKGPNVIDRIKESPLNNPLTRGIVRTGLYTLNPTLGPLDFRKAMQLKGLYDTTKEGIYGDVDEEDMQLGLITDTQKDLIDKQMKMGELTGAFDPDATFNAAKMFDDKGETKTLGIFGEDRPAEPMTREEFDAYVRENRAGGGPVGGIMDLESGRQMYFLGKLVKKATRAVKKIVKSPIGKAALLYAGGTYLGGLKGITGATKSMGFLEALRTPSNLGNLFNFGREYIGDAIGGMKKKICLN